MPAVRALPTNSSRREMAAQGGKRQPCAVAGQFCSGSMTSPTVASSFCAAKAAESSASPRRRSTARSAGLLGARGYRRTGASRPATRPRRFDVALRRGLASKAGGPLCKPAADRVDTYLGELIEHPARLGLDQVQSLT